MKGGFEELKTLNADSVYDKTHISQSVFENIVNKRFENLKPIQTKGLIKILEESYELDLSDLLNEYNSYLATNISKPQTLDKLTTESLIIKKKKFPKTLFVVFALIIAGVVVSISLNNNTTQEINETNLSNEINETHINALLNAPIDFNSTAIQDVNMSDTGTVLVSEANKTAAPLGATKFEITPKKPLWLGIYYTSEDNKSDFRNDLNTTTQLNSLRPQILVIAPASFSLKLGDSTIESSNDGVARYVYFPSEKRLQSISKQEFETLRPQKKQQQ